MEYQPKPNPIEYEPRSADAQRLDLLVSELRIYERGNLDLKKKDEIVAQMQTLAGQRYVDRESHLTALARVQEWTGLEVQAIICRRFDFCLYNRLILAAWESKVSYEFDPMFLHISDKVKIKGDNLLVGHLSGPLQNYDEKKWDLDCLDHKIARIRRQVRKIEKDELKDVSKDKIAEFLNESKKDGLRIKLEKQLGKAGKLGDVLSDLEASIKDDMRKLPISVVVFSPEEIEIVSTVNTWIGRQLEVLVPLKNSRISEYQVDTIVGAVMKTTLPWVFYDTVTNNVLTRVGPRASIVRSENEEIKGIDLVVGHLLEPLETYDEKKWDLDCIDHKIARIKRQLMKIEKDDKKHGVNGPKKDELRIMLEEQLGKAGKLGDFLSGLEASVKDTMRKLPNSVVVFRPEEIEIVSAVNTWIGRQLGVLVPIENHRFFEYQVDAIVGAVKKTTLPWTFYDTLSHNRLTRIRPRASIVRSENFIDPSEYEL